MYRVGISCIGGGVGQSVVNSCRLSRLPVKTVGFDTNPFAYGAYDCDLFDYVPSVSDKNYIDILIDKCKKHDIDLIIPGLDDEILMYARNMEKFENEGIKPLVSGEELIRLCRDKEKMSLELNTIANVFVTSYDRDTLTRKSSCDSTIFPLIAKPRGGSASKGIQIIHNADDLDNIHNGHIIQELAVPAKTDPNYAYYLEQIEQNNNPQVSEISIQIVTDKNGQLIGEMASYNRLKDGIPTEVVPIEDNRIWEVIDELLPHFKELGLRGPLNIQGRLTENGLKIFEMNPRFTGITGLRALMGFNEVESCLVSWLDLDREQISLSLNGNRFGVRQTADKAVPVRRNEQVGNLSLRINTEPPEKSKTLCVTGAANCLAYHFICSILDEEDYPVWAYDRDKTELASLLPQGRVRLFDRSDFQSGALSIGNIDVLLHFDFADYDQPAAELAQTLAFSNELFTSAAMHHTPAIVHISTKSVYGSDRASCGSEEMPAAPDTAFAQAAYAAELMLRNLSRINNQVKATSLRLATLIGEDYGYLPPVGLPGRPQQQNALPDNHSETDADNPEVVEWLDIRDAVQAIKSVIKVPESQWKPIYNVGSGRTCSTQKITEIIAAHTKEPDKKVGSKPITEDVTAGMQESIDNSLFRKDTGWKPSYGMGETIDSLISHFQPQVPETKKVP